MTPLRFIVIVLIALVASGCSQPAPEGIRMGLASAPITLDPRFATDATSSRVNRLLYQHLVDFDDNSLPIPALGRWEQLEPTRYRVHLTSDARFHDGQVLSARDVKATYDSVLDPATGSPHLSALAIVERVEQVDERTLDFHLRHTDPLFPAYLTLGILPARGIAQGQPFGEQPLGSGPYRFVARHADGAISLRRLRDGQTLTLVPVKDPTVRTLKLMRGEIDLVQNDLPPELYRYLSERDDIRVEHRRGSNFSYLGFNIDDPVMRRLEVRQAIAHGIDRTAIIRYVMADGAVTAESLLPPSHWAGGQGLEPFPYDPDKARALLRRAGFGLDHPLKLNYKTSTDPFRVRLATIIQSQLADVGIEVDVRSYDWGTFYGDIKAGNFQMFSLAWVGINTPDIFRYVFHSESLPPDGANRGRYRSERVDRLLAKAQSAQTLDQQAPSYREIQRVLHEELPYVPLWYEDQIVVRRADIHGYHAAADGNYDALVDIARAGLASAR